MVWKPVPVILILEPCDPHRSFYIYMSRRQSCLLEVDGTNVNGDGSPCALALASFTLEITRSFCSQALAEPKEKEWTHSGIRVSYVLFFSPSLENKCCFLISPVSWARSVLVPLLQFNLASDLIWQQFEFSGLKFETSGIDSSLTHVTGSHHTEFWMVSVL